MISESERAEIERINCFDGEGYTLVRQIAEDCYIAGKRAALEEAARMVERKLFLYADVAACAAAIRALKEKK